MNILLNTLLAQTLAATAAIALVALLRRPLARAFDARASYLLWWCVPMALLVAALPSPWRIEAPPLSELPAWLALADTPVPAAAPRAAQPAPTPLPWAQIAVTAWGAGAVLLALLLTRQQRRFTRTLRQGPGGAHWWLPAGASPCVVGVWPARLALPEDFGSRFSAEERELILAHEGVHLQRRDNLWNLLAAACCCLQWFNPLAWWAWRRMRADQELACDAAVLIDRQPAAGLAPYAQALLRSHAQASKALLPTLASPWRSRSGLVERVALLQAHAARRGRKRRGRALIAALVAATAGTVSAVAAVQPVAEPLAPPRGWMGALTNPLPAGLAGYAEPTMLRWHTTVREDGRPPHKRTDFMMLMPGQGPAGNTVKYVQSDLSGPLWCMQMETHRLEDGGWRAAARLLAPDCTTFFSEASAIVTDGSAQSLNGRLPDGRAVTLDIAAQHFALPPQVVWVDAALTHNLDAVSRARLRLMGEQGTRMRIASRPQPGDSRPPLAVDVTVTPTDDGRARVQTRLLLGEPARVLAEPAVVTAWGEPARIAWQDPAGEQQVELRLTPHRSALSR